MEIKVGEVYAFKLISGQELVATLNSVDAEYYHLSKPLTLGQGAQGMEYMQAIFCAELLGDAALPKLSAMVSPAREDVIESYKLSCEPEKKILTPNKQIITG